MVCTIFSKLDEYEFSEPTAVVVSDGPGIAKRLDDETHSENKVHVRHAFGTHALVCTFTHETQAKRKQCVGNLIGREYICVCVDKPQNKHVHHGKTCFSQKKLV